MLEEISCAWNWLSATRTQQLRGRLIFMKRMFEGFCGNDNIMILRDFLISVVDFFQLWYQVGYRVLLRGLFYE